MPNSMKTLIVVPFLFIATACSSTADRQPTSFNRAGRPNQPGKVMNRYPLDTNSLYNACTKERAESYCKNRLGR